MKFILLFILTFSSLFAKLSIAVAYPYIGKITHSIAHNKVKIQSLSRGNWDPHFVVPKPSLIATLRDTDLLIINGASLETAWLSPLLKGANNAKILPNSKGYLDLSQYIKLQDIPRTVDRSMGHIHAEGNPHFILDPHNVIKLAKVIYIKLAILDATNKGFYKQNFLKFKKHWQRKISGYDKKMQKCKNMKVVQYHELFNYFLHAYGIISIDNLEPLAGVKPNPRHTMKLINEIKENKVKFILQDVYHEHKTADFIAKKTGAKVLKLPHDVGAMKGITSLDHFYDYLLKSLCK